MRILGKDNGQHVVDIDGEVKHLNDAELDELRATLGLPPLSEPVDAPAEATVVTDEVSLVSFIRGFAEADGEASPEVVAEFKLLRDSLVERYPYDLDEVLGFVDATPESLLEALIVSLPSDPTVLTEKAAELLQNIGKLAAAAAIASQPTTEPPAEKVDDQKAEADKPTKPEKGGK